MEINCYEKILNNYIENIYMKVLLETKNQQETLIILNKVCDLIFLFDNYDISKIHDRINKECEKFIKEYKENNKQITYSKDYEIPEVIYLYNFNIAKLFNERDLSIFMYFLVFNESIINVCKFTGYDQEFVLQRFKAIFNYIKKMYVNNIKCKV